MRVRIDFLCENAQLSVLAGGVRTQKQPPSLVLHKRDGIIGGVTQAGRLGKEAGCRKGIW